MDVKRKNIPLFLTSTILFGIKTYIIYRFIFNLELKNAQSHHHPVLHTLPHAGLRLLPAVFYGRYADRRSLFRAHHSGRGFYPDAYVSIPPLERP